MSHVALPLPVQAPRLPGVRRLPVALLGLAGGVTALVGAFLPWISTFAGLVRYAGVRGGNGRVVATLGALAAALALGYALRGGAALRIALGGVGFALSGFVGYLLVQLDATFPALAADPMAIARRESGLYVCAAGALTVFATLFLPGERRATDPRASIDPRAATDLRWIGVVALAVAAAAHVPVVPEHLRSATYVGVLFVAFSVAAAGLAVVLARSEAPRVWAGVAGLSAAALSAYALSRSVALPQIGDDVGNWREPLGMVAAAAESIALVVATVRLAEARLRRAA